MNKARHTFSTDPEIVNMMKELARADNRNVSNYLTALIKREYLQLKMELKETTKW